MVLIKSPEEIGAMRRAGAMVGRFFEEVREIVRPGITTWDFEEFAEEFVAKHGIRAAFKGYLGYPASLCVSVNEEVVHGIPSRSREIREGDIVSLDFGVICEGFYGDAARTFAVGKIPDSSRHLIETTERSLDQAIAASVSGNRLGDISASVQETVEAEGFSVVRDFVGHGIGRTLHEDPQVPNFGHRGSGPKLVPGMVLAIEPMVNEGGYPVEVLPDGWTVVTRDRKRSAHAEHMVAIMGNGNLILSLP